MAFGNNKELRLNITGNKTGIDKAFNEVGLSAKKLAGALVAAFSVDAFARSIKRSIEFGGEIHDLSQKLGISAQVLTEYKHVAELSGASFDQLTKAMRLTAKSVVDAENGITKQKAALAALGLEAKDLIGLSIDKQFETIGQKISEVENPAQKVTLAMALMGKSGADIIPVFADGAQAISDMRKEAVDLGITFGGDVSKQLEAAGDNLTRLEGSARGLGITLAIEVVPALNDFLQGLTNLIRWVPDDVALLRNLEDVMLNLAAATPDMFGMNDLAKDVQASRAAAAATKEHVEEVKELGEMWDKATAPYVRMWENAKKEYELTKKRTPAIIDHAAAVKKNAVEVDKNADAFDKLAAATERQQEKFTALDEEMRRASEEAMQPWVHAIENVQDSFADMLVAGEFSFDSLAQIAKRAAAEAAAAWIIRPTFDAVGGAIFGGSTSSSGGGGSSGFGSLAQTGISKGLWLTGIGSGLDAWGASALPGLFATGAAPIYTGVGAVGGATTLASAGSSAGVLGGAGIGLSSIALPIAALAVTTLLSGLFKGSRPHPAASFEFDSIGADGSLKGLDLQAKHLDTAVAKAFSDALSGSFAGLQGAGLDLSSIGTVQGGVDDGRGFLQLVGQGTNQFDPQDAEAANEAMSALLLQITKSAANFSDIFETDVLDELDALVIKGREVGEVLQDLVSIATLDVRRNQFNEAVADRILQLTDEQAYKIKLINKEFDALLEAAKGLGGDTAQVELLRQMVLEQESGNDTVQEAANAAAAAAKAQGDALTQLADGFQRFADSLQATLTGVLLGAESALSPEAKLKLAQSNFDAALGGGDYGALSGASTALLGIARENFASGGQYKDIFSNVTGALSGTISGLNNQASQARAQAVSYYQMAAPAASNNDGLQVAIREMAAQQAKTNSYIHALAVTTRVQ